MPPVPVARIPLAFEAFLHSVLPGGLFVAWEGVQAEVPAKALWVRPTFLPGSVLDGEKGKDGYARRDGLYYVEIIAPEPVPVHEAWDLAVIVEKAFRREQVECVNLEDPYTSSLGVDKYNAFRVRVTIPWWCWTV